MTTLTHSFAQLSNHDLLDLVKRLGSPQTRVRLAPERYKVQVTVGRETFEKLRRPGPAATLHPERRSCGSL